MHSYLGIQKITLDERGRLAFPSALKVEANIAAESHIKICEGIEIIVGIDPEGAITLYKEFEWVRTFAQIQERHRKDPAKQVLWKRVASFAEKQKIDSVGRILIPESILEFADINAPSKKGVYLSVEENHLRLWGEANWRAELDWIKCFGKRTIREHENVDDVILDD